MFMESSKVYVASNEANLQLSITALKSLLSELALRVKQSEEMTAKLLNDNFSQQALIQHVTTLLSEHSEHRGKERAVHQQAVLQSLLISLIQLKNVDDLSVVHDSVNSIVKSLTLTMASMSPN